MPLSARVPDSVKNGFFCTSVIVVTGSYEFILDFVQGFETPAIICARVIIPHAVLGSFAGALKKNLEDYENTHGSFDRNKVESLKEENAKESNQPSPTPQDVYDDLSISDETIMGCYANGVMMRYTEAEFKFDFLSNFIPRATINCRIFMSAIQTARMSNTISNTYAAFLKS
jgi:hypothetical protein